VIPRRTAKRLAGVAAAGGAGGSIFIGLSRVDSLSLAVLGATLVIVVVVLAITGYKVIDRWFRHLERWPPIALVAPEETIPGPENKRTPA
jgi:ABC-type proline/glycine betaine transport system permease subunit